VPTINHLPIDPCCPCGGRLEVSTRRCRKCRARARWRRRMAYRKRPVSPRRPQPRAGRGRR
jgi:hypothetical protein